MFDNNQAAKNGKLNGVSCSVTACTHHGSGNSCTAGHISVGTEYASSKPETLCATFEQDSGQ